MSIQQHSLLFNDSLPIELWIKIGSYLDGASIAIAFRINKAWNEVFNDKAFWKQIAGNRDFHHKEEGCTWKETIRPTYELRHTATCAISVINIISKIHKEVELLLDLKDAWNCLSAIGYPHGQFTFLGKRPTQYENLSKEIIVGLNHAANNFNDVIKLYDKFSEDFKNKLNEQVNTIHLLYHQIFHIISIPYKPFEKGGTPPFLQLDKIKAAIDYQKRLTDHFHVPKINFSTLITFLKPYSNHALKASFKRYEDFIKKYQNYLIRDETRFAIQFYAPIRDTLLWSDRYQLIFTKRDDEISIDDPCDIFFKSGHHNHFWFKFTPHASTLFKLITLLKNKSLPVTNRSSPRRILIIYDKPVT